MLLQTSCGPIVRHPASVWCPSDIRFKPPSSWLWPLSALEVPPKVLVEIYRGPQAIFLSFLFCSKCKILEPPPPPPTPQGERISRMMKSASYSLATGLTVSQYSAAEGPTDAQIAVYLCDCAITPHDFPLQSEPP